MTGVTPLSDARLEYGAGLLDPAIRSRRVDNVNGLSMHCLEAGFETPGRPRVILLHGFPELAFSWRRQLPALAAAGFHVLAPDQRGYGRTTGWSPAFTADIAPFRFYNLVLDALSLVFALGYRQAFVVGHDFGSPVAAWCAVMRPDVFRKVVLMSAPFGGTPAEVRLPRSQDDPFLKLSPPRIHYQTYYSTPEADGHMRNAPGGISRFLRGYYHVKSGDWADNQPFALPVGDRAAMAALPRYYLMDRERTMAETIEDLVPDLDVLPEPGWLTRQELTVYAKTFGETGFQGGLNWYRCATNPRYSGDLALFAGRAIDVPACFIGGARDWGVYQTPGALERMQSTACTRLSGVHLVRGAGHWVQQEQYAETNRVLLKFLE